LVASGAGIIVQIAELGTGLQSPFGWSEPEQIGGDARGPGEALITESDIESGGQTAVVGDEGDGAELHDECAHPEFPSPPHWRRGSIAEPACLLSGYRLAVAGPGPPAGGADTPAWMVPAGAWPAAGAGLGWEGRQRGTPAVPLVATLLRRGQLTAHGLPLLTIQAASVAAHVQA
jgi:hypothetical protein